MHGTERTPTPLPAYAHLNLQVTDTTETTVTCTALNDATLDGLLTVMVRVCWVA